MSGHIECEMINCLDQMRKLQEKIEILQKEKNNKAAEEVVKKEEVEPNLRIMYDWLDKYGEIIDEIEHERVIVEQYRNFYDNGINNISNKIQKYEFVLNMVSALSDKEHTSSKDREYQYKKARSYNIHVTKDQDILQNPDILQILDECKPTKEEYELYNNREVIKERYLSLEQKKKSGYEYRSGVEARAQILHNCPTFVSRNNPTYFMKQIIESTHNMFLIHEKRINELEQKIKAVYPKLLLNEDFDYNFEDSNYNYEDPRRL